VWECHLLPYEITKTTNYRFQFNKLTLRFKRFVEEALEMIKETPTSLQGKITHLANSKEGALYRFRLPGCYIIYVVPPHEPGESVTITLTGIKMLY
jgi:hypothetical protein